MQTITECAALLAHGRRQNIRPRSKGLAYEYYEVDLLMNARATRDDLRAPLLAAAAAAGGVYPRRQRRARSVLVVPQRSSKK